MENIIARVTAIVINVGPRRTKLCARISGLGRTAFYDERLHHRNRQLSASALRCPRRREYAERRERK